MSIATDLTRLQTAKADLKTAIEGKGVTVPSATKIDGYADLVDAIQTGGGGGGDAVMQQVTNIGTNALKNAVLPEVANFSSLTYMGEHAFQSVSGVKTMVFPKLETTGNYPVSDTTDTETVDIGATYTSASFAGSGWFFSGNTKMSTLILRRSSVLGMPNINCFYNTPFASGGSGGTLYVPQSLISSYQTATNWSTILGYSNNSIQAIEGSVYETAYADGTPI